MADNDGVVVVLAGSAELDGLDALAADLHALLDTTTAETPTRHAEHNCMVPGCPEHDDPTTEEADRG